VTALSVDATSPAAMDQLERFARGDADAFEAIFRQHQAEVYRWIVRLVRDPAAAEDLTIETFWRIYCRRSRFDPARQFIPWARRIATRLAIDHLRSVPPPAIEWREPAGNDSEPLCARDLRRHIEKAFASLPARLRAAATLALIEEVPHREIADALDISVSAVKMRVARAVRRLRASLERVGIRP
jgi:RNA polymerase sigma-70 factor (ECF subfamily)